MEFADVADPPNEDLINCSTRAVLPVPGAPEIYKLAGEVEPTWVSRNSCIVDRSCSRPTSRGGRAERRNRDLAFSNSEGISGDLDVESRWLGADNGDAPVGERRCLVPAPLLLNLPALRSLVGVEVGEISIRVELLTTGLLFSKSESGDPCCSLLDRRQFTYWGMINK